jgi:hypothetical protein
MICKALVFLVSIATNGKALPKLVLVKLYAFERLSSLAPNTHYRCY